MRQCSVPRCTTSKLLHTVPFTDKLRWEQWTAACPYFLKYNRRQLENVKICNKHFLPSHINEKGRLTKDAVPMFYLKPSDNKKKNVSVISESKILEISPIEPNELVNFKVVAPISLSARIDNTFKHPSIEDIEEKQQVTNGPQQQMKNGSKQMVTGDQSHGFLVDHMYCLPSRANERQKCVSSPCVMCQAPSKELETSDSTTVSIEAGQEPRTSPLPDITADCMPMEYNQTKQTLSPLECNIKTESVAECTVDAPLWTRLQEETLSAASSNAGSVVSQTVAAAPHNIYNQQSEQVPDSLPADMEHSLKNEPETVELLNSQLTPLDDDNMHKNVYVLPHNTVIDESVQTDSHVQSAVYLSPNVFNLLKNKSPLEKDTLESIKALFSALKTQYNLPFNVSTEYSQTQKFTRTNPSNELNKPSEFNIQSSAFTRTANVVQSLNSKPVPKHTLESLVAELTESVNADEMEELQPSPAVMAAKTPLNPTSDTAPCAPMQGVSATTLHPALESNSEIRRVRLDKENSTPNERMLRSQNNTLKLKLRNLNLKYRRLKSKSDSILAKAKEFIKNYPHLRRESKLMVDLQIRLARTHSKGARYSEEEKMFALKLLNISPECYKYMQPLLKLPAMTTMKEFEKNA